MADLLGIVICFDTVLGVRGEFADNPFLDLERAMLELLQIIPEILSVK